MALLKALMPNAFRRRIDAWIAKRNPATDSNITLRNKRLYILPTRFGYIYALMLLVLLLAAINYQNSMAYALTFLLTAIGIVSLWQTHKNLLGLNIGLKAPEPVFSGEQLNLEFNLRNEHHSPRYAVGIQYDMHPPNYIRVDPGELATLCLHLPAGKRGSYSLGGFTIFTRYPTGLFHAWSWIRFNTTLLIYPQPLYDHKLQHSLIDDHSGKSTVDITDGDDFAGLREHRTGESLRHISWKAYAQGRGMLTKTFQGHATPALWIQWNDMSASSIEGKLSQMTALVLQAQQGGQKYGLKLPSIAIEQNTGSAHKANCLHRLATYRQTHSGEEYHSVDE